MNAMIEYHNFWIITLAEQRSGTELIESPSEKGICEFESNITAEWYGLSEAIVFRAFLRSGAVIARHVMFQFMITKAVDPSTRSRHAGSRSALKMEMVLAGVALT